jgi:glyoxylase-like metal-dependent hydrolase (beta-lactamase superfamily II)
MFGPNLSGSPDKVDWESLASLLKAPYPLFEKTLFLQGYEFSSNIYVITGDYLSIIDPGNDYTAFMELFSLGFKPPDIKKIVLTHGHMDHVGGTIELFRGYRGYQNLDLEVILHEAGPLQFKEMAKGLGCRLTEVRGGEILDLSGFEFEVIHTPGHTLDGLCLYHAPSRTLFSGDTVLPHAMAEVDKEGGGRMDHYLYALRTLRKKEIEYVMPGHGGIVDRIGKKVVDGTYEGLIKKVVGPETPWLEGAMTLAQQGLLEEGLFYCDQDLAAEPEKLRTLETRAFLLNDLGRQEEAVAGFDKVLAQRRDHFYALMGKGTALTGLGKFGESLTCFDQALHLRPGDKEALVSKGLALFLSGKTDDAMDIEEFRQEYSERIKQFLKDSSKSAEGQS